MCGNGLEQLVIHTTAADSERVHKQKRSDSHSSNNKNRPLIKVSIIFGIAIAFIVEKRNRLSTTATTKKPTHFQQTYSEITAQAEKKRRP